MQNGSSSRVSFYVLNHDSSGPILQKILASILVAQSQSLRNTLNEELELVTSAAPDTPQSATTQQTTNSATVTITSFQPSQVREVAVD